MKLSLILYVLPWLLRFKAWSHKEFRDRLKEKNLTVQFKVADDSIGRSISIKDGRIISAGSIHPSPDVVISFKSEAIAADLLMLPIDYQVQIDAIKNFNLKAVGPDELITWFSETILMSQTVGWQFGTPVENGETRYVNQTNGGPVHVYVKDGKIVRMTPIDFQK